jgi:hypothetical protein
MSSARIRMMFGLLTAADATWDAASNNPAKIVGRILIKVYMK